VPQVEVPSRYRVPTRGEGLIEVEGHTVRECIRAVEARYPGFEELIFDSKGHIHRFVKLFVNEEEIPRNAPDVPVEAADRIQILAAAAGG
jgi:molybdopterin converting factor small subunit